MPKPTPPHIRAAIETDIRAGQHTRNHIARTHHVSGATVTKIANNLKTLENITTFDRSGTTRAREALGADVGLRRVELAGLLLEDAFRVRMRMWEEQVEYLGSADGPVRVVRPTNASEFRNFMTAIGIAVDKVGMLTSTGQAEKEASSLIRSLVDDARARRTPVSPVGAGVA